MSKLNDCHDPGILLVLTRPTSSRYLEDFHDWYNTEHGPARLQLGTKYFSNGYRYKTNDNSTWLAIYDMKRLSAGADKTYTSLREHRSAREQEVLRNKVKVLSRQFLKLILQTSEASKPARTICCVSFNVRNGQSGPVGTSYDEVSLSISCG